jgi:hypothetical protein
MPPHRHPANYLFFEEKTHAYAYYCDELLSS